MSQENCTQQKNYNFTRDDVIIILNHVRNKTLENELTDYSEGYLRGINFALDTLNEERICSFSQD